MLKKPRDSLIKGQEEIEAKGLEESVKSVGNPNEAAELVKKIDRFIKSMKKNILLSAYQQGMVFRKFKKKQQLC